MIMLTAALLFNAIVSLALVSVLYYLWRQTKAKDTSPLLDLDAIPKDIKRIRQEPFAKPSGKRQPKVNDDTAGWKREQKEEYYPDPNH